MKISIVIPTYEMCGMGTKFLSNNFEILRNQTHKNFEIIISDHSLDDEIQNLCEGIIDMDIKYIKNSSDLGNSSANTNKGISESIGDIIKILFQDDFLAHNRSLEDIVNSFEKSDISWLVTASNHTYDGVTLHNENIPYYDKSKLFIGHNTISSPSVLSFSNNDVLLFNEELIWMMDCEYYIRLQEKFGDPHIIESVNVINRLWSKQLTNTIDPEVKKRELLYMKEKYGEVICNAVEINNLSHQIIPNNCYCGLVKDRVRYNFCQKCNKLY